MLFNIGSITKIILWSGSLPLVLSSILIQRVYTDNDVLLLLADGATIIISVRGRICAMLVS